MVVVTHMHRLSRSRAECYDIEDALRKDGITVEYIMEPTSTEPFSFESKVLATMDYHLRQRMSVDIKRGQHRALSQGFYLGARPPFGYLKNTTTVDGKRRSTLEIVPHEADAISAAYDLAKTGKTLQKIAVELNERNLSSPTGTPWTSRTVRTILKNEIYTGTVTWGTNRENPATFEGVAPVIILKEIFMTVQHIIKGQRPRATQAPIRLTTSSPS